MIEKLNSLNAVDLKKALTQCCGSSRWVDKMHALFPFQNENKLFEAAEKAWYTCTEPDWLEAFNHHPKIGDLASLKENFSATKKMAETEQASVADAPRDFLVALADSNLAYQEKFGYIFIVFATGKQAGEMLALLHSRLSNDPQEEIKIAVAEQHKITILRLKKLLDHEPCNHSHT